MPFLHCLNDVERALPAGDLFFEGQSVRWSGIVESFRIKNHCSRHFFGPAFTRGNSVSTIAGARSVVSGFPDRCNEAQIIATPATPKSIPSLKDLENIERRAAGAYTELKEAWRFEYVIPNHDGEDSENWDAFYYQ